MDLYLNIILGSLVFAGLSSLIIGIVSIFHGKNKSKAKVKNGWRIAVFGGILCAIFIPILIAIVQEEMDPDSGFFFSVFIISVLFYPFLIVAVVVCLIFLLTIGISSLESGYIKNEEGKRDVETIILGYIFVGLAAIVATSATLFLCNVFRLDLYPHNKANSSEPPNSDISALINHVLNVLMR